MIKAQDNIQVEKHRKDTNNNYRYIFITNALHIYNLQMMKYLSNRSQFLWVYRRDNPRGMLGEHSKSLKFSMSLSAQ